MCKYIKEGSKRAGVAFHDVRKHGFFYLRCHPVCFIKGKIVNILGLVGQMILVTYSTLQL